MFVDTNHIHIATSIDEDKLFNECNEAITHIMDLMKSLNCNEMMSEVTGEVVTFEDLGRMKGILGGLPIMTTMYNTKEQNDANIRSRRLSGCDCTDFNTKKIEFSVDKSLFIDYNIGR